MSLFLVAGHDAGGEMEEKCSKSPPYAAFGGLK
jgi:hypothetical protein